MRDKYIKVYNGVGALIATFSCDTADEIKDQREQIYNPRVEIDEDSSIASFDVYQESDVWAKISGEDKIYEIDGRRYFIYGEPSEIADTRMIRVTLCELWYELDKKFVQAYNVSGALEFIGEYSVVLVPFSDAPLYVNGEAKSNPLIKDNLGYYIWALLQGTGYTLEYCDVVDDTYNAGDKLSAFELETEGISVLENLNVLKKLTDCIYKWDTINKELRVYSKENVTSEINKWQGYEIREGVNLTSIEKRINTNIITRVIPYGYDNLVISSVNSGLIYLDNNSYSEKIYAKIIHNPDIQNPQALKVWAQKELAKICRPNVEYEVGFALRQDADYAHETLNLYDIARVIYYDKEIGQEVVDSQRVISLKYDVWKKSAIDARLGDKMLRWQQNLQRSVVNGIKVGQVLSSSGTISTGSIYYGSGENKKRLSSVLGGVESTIAQIEATADEDRANVELISLYTNAAKGVKTVQEYTPETWDNDYIYYVSQGTYAGYWRWEVSEWVETQPMNSTLATVNVTATRALANVELLAKYTSSVDEIVEVVNTSGQATWDTQFIYYVTATDKFYKHNGTTWEITDNMTTQVASIQTTANANSAKVALVVEQVEGVNVIKTASIVAAINDAGSTITIDADKINFAGFATFMRGADYLSAGKTTIDGGKITTNSITASQINASNLEVAAANVTGKLAASQIDVTGLITAGALVITSDLPTNLSDLNNDAGYKDYAGVTTIIDGYVDADFINARDVVAKRLQVTHGGKTIFSANANTGSVVISPDTLDITVAEGKNVVELSGVGTNYITGGEGALSLYAYDGISIYSPEGELSLYGGQGILSQSDISLAAGTRLWLSGLSNHVAYIISDHESRISALEGGCGSCDSCEYCEGCENCDSCESCDTCQTCLACQSCDSGCQSGDSCGSCVSCDDCQDCDSCDASCESCDSCQTCVTCQVCDACEIGCDTCQECDSCDDCEECDSCDISCEGCDSCLGCDVCQYCESNECDLCQFACDTCDQCDNHDAACNVVDFYE